MQSPSVGDVTTDQHTELHRDGTGCLRDYLRESNKHGQRLSQEGERQNIITLILCANLPGGRQKVAPDAPVSFSEHSGR